jgi:hypothetical protein
MPGIAPPLLQIGFRYQIPIALARLDYDGALPGVRDLAGDDQFEVTMPNAFLKFCRQAIEGQFHSYAADRCRTVIVIATGFSLHVFA